MWIIKDINNKISIFMRDYRTVADFEVVRITNDPKVANEYLCCWKYEVEEVESIPFSHMIIHTKCGISDHRFQKICFTSNPMIIKHFDNKHGYEVRKVEQMEM